MVSYDLLFHILSMNIIWYFDTIKLYVNFSEAYSVFKCMILITAHY